MFDISDYLGSVEAVWLIWLLAVASLALLTRAAPQLNLYSIGFPLRVLVSLGATLVLLPPMLTGMVSMFSYFLELLQLRG